MLIQKLNDNQRRAHEAEMRKLRLEHEERRSELDQQNRELMVKVQNLEKRSIEGREHDQDRTRI